MNIGQTRTNLKVLAYSRSLLFFAVLVHYLFWVPTYEIFFGSDAHLYFFCVVFGAAFAAVGCVTPWAIVICLFGHLYFLEKNMFAFWGWASVVPVIMMLHVVAPNDFYLNVRKKTSYIRSYVPLYMLLAYLSLIYLSTNLSRFGNADWENGEVLIYTLLNPVFSRFAQLNYFNIQPLLNIAGIVGWVFELIGIILFLIPHRKLRTMIATGLIALHTLLLLTTKLQAWSPLMISLLILSWAHLPWDKKPRQYVTRVFAVVALYFSIMAVYIGTIQFKYSDPRGNFIYRILTDSDLGRVRVTQLFKRSSHEIGQVFTVYALKSSGYDPVFTSPMSQYLAISAAPTFEPFTEILHRLQTLGPNSIDACQTLNRIFNLKVEQFIVRRVSLIHYKETGASVEKVDSVFSCSILQSKHFGDVPWDAAEEKKRFSERLKKLEL